jgi:hypothetical protein
MGTLYKWFFALAMVRSKLLNPLGLLKVSCLLLIEMNSPHPTTPKIYYFKKIVKNNINIIKI